MAKVKPGEIICICISIIVASLSRCAFIMLEQFKPMAGIVILTGFAFGAIPGGICGVASAVLTAPVFGIGSWVYAQMLCFGLAGMLAGRLRRIKSIDFRQPLMLAISGAAYIMLIGGPILDLYTMVVSPGQVSLTDTLIRGIPFNAVHAIATFLVILIFTRPVLVITERLKNAYGLFERQEKT